MMNEISILKSTVDSRGLREFRASGGSATNFYFLKKKLQHLSGPIIIVDGIEEFHGYLNGIPTALLAYQFDKYGFRQGIRRLIFTGSLKMRRELVVSEKEEAKRYGFGYKKINITSQSYPKDSDIEEIVQFFESLPESAWLHFHCYHGKGRTSCLIAMLDIMKNAPLVKLKDIIERQHALGSVDLFDTTKWKNGRYTQEILEKRKKFIEDFYTFVVQRKNKGIQLWSMWRQKQRDR